MPHRGACFSLPSRPERPRVLPLEWSSYECRNDRNRRDLAQARAGLPEYRIPAGRLHRYRPPGGREVRRQYGAEFVPTYEEVCRHAAVDYVDVCTFPDFRLEPLLACARAGKHIQVQKPSRRIWRPPAAWWRPRGRPASCWRGEPAPLRRCQPVSFQGHSGRPPGAPDRVRCLRQVVPLAGVLRAPHQGKLENRGGGALINQAVHQIDILRWLAGPVAEVSAFWQLGALHRIESEDVVNAVLRYAGGATGVIQASTAFWPATPSASSSTAPRARPLSPATS